MKYREYHVHVDRRLTWRVYIVETRKKYFNAYQITTTTASAVNCEIQRKNEIFISLLENTYKNVVLKQ